MDLSANDRFDAGGHDEPWPERGAAL